MSIIETLTEGIVNRDMKKEGSALLSKWGKTGLLEGLQTEHEKAGMARLLENQAKELLRESSSMAAGDVEGFAAVAFPIVRRVFAGLIANQLVSVQPMSLPSGLIFFLDFVYSPSLNGSDTQDSRFGNHSGSSIYGTDKVASEVISGVNLVGDLGEGFGGPGRDGSTGYAYASPQTLQTLSSSNSSPHTLGAQVAISAMTETQKKLVKYDVDVLAETASNLLEIKVPIASLTNPDLDNLSAFDVSGSAVGNLLNSANLTDSTTKLIRRLTSEDGTNISLFFVSSHADALTVAVSNLDGDYAHLDHPTKDSVGEKSSGVGALDSYTML